MNIEKLHLTQLEKLSPKARPHKLIDSQLCPSNAEPRSQSKSNEVPTCTLWHRRSTILQSLKIQTAGQANKQIEEEFQNLVAVCGPPRWNNRR